MTPLRSPAAACPGTRPDSHEVIQVRSCTSLSFNLVSFNHLSFNFVSFTLCREDSCKTP